MEKAGRVHERIDEEIGALLDGRVQEGRRSELLARIEADDDDYRVFADVAAVLREAEEEASEKEPQAVSEDEDSSTTKVIPLRPRRSTGWRSPAVRILAAAAALAALALVPVLRSRANERAWRDPARLAALASPGSAPLPAEWEPAWGVQRGDGRTAASDGGIAARIGALDVDARVAAASGDTAAV